MSNEFAAKVLKDMANVAMTASDPEKQRAFEEEMQIQQERAKKVDALCMEALEAMSAGVGLIQKVLVENDTTIEQIVALTDNMSKLGAAMAQLRIYMGYGSFVSGAGYGFGA